MIRLCYVCLFAASLLSGLRFGLVFLLPPATRLAILSDDRRCSQHTDEPFFAFPLLCSGGGGGGVDDVSRTQHTEGFSSVCVSVFDLVRLVSLVNPSPSSATDRW
uniref:Putative secreted peptide n=1 Tax=Anopheles braziliensis TaxID=58242 RepID=A0A2M3ZR57_9DIPT